MAKFFKRFQDRSAAASESLQVKFEAVEPRVLFSATAVDPVDEAVQSHHDLPLVQEEAPVLTSATPDLSANEEVAAPTSSEDRIIESLNHHAADLDANESREIVFISAGVFDQDYVANQLDPAYEIYLIEPGSDAIAQIAEALEGRSDISAIHLIGHGEEGRLFLGDTVLDADSMEGMHRAALEAIGQTLSADADILIYGCDFTSGEEGIEAASLLAALTGADVAASTDKTGHAELGGDWELETEIGLIEAQSLSLGNWQGVLAAPVITIPSAELSTLEDTAFTFSGANLISVDSDTYPTLTVSISVGQGALNLSGSTGITFLNGTQNGDSLLEISGTIADLNASLDGLVFSPAQDVFGAETISLTVDDGDEISSSSIGIAVISQNDAPVITVNPVNVSATGTPSETAPHTFTLADFEAIDPDNTNNQLTFILNALPSVGELRLNGYPVAVGTVFTQAALDSGALVYIHNGGENHSDSFTLTVNDGAGGTDALVVIPISITPVNDSMTVVTESVVYEGGSTSDGAIAPGKPLPVLNLGISDAEADTKTVTITSLPAGGSLYFNGTLVTQAAVDGGFSFDATDYGMLEYRHDGVDDLITRPSNRSFTITVTDLGGGAGVASTQIVNHTVNITVVAVNDDLSLVTLSTAVPTITSGNSYVLGLSDLEVNDPDGPSSQLTYTLQASPLLGDLYIAGQLSGAGATFTQAQLAAGQVVFTNGGANGPDSLFFKVTDSQISILTDELGTLRTGDHTTPARILELQFNLTASGGGGALIRLEEGQSAPVTVAAPGDTIQLTANPAQGQVLVNGTPLGVGVSYLVQPGDLVTYLHNGAHVDSDLIEFDLNGTPTTIDVVVLLTNDAPVLTILSTVTGIYEGTSGSITTAHLIVTDEETTDPAHLIYTVIGSPSAGSILRDGNVLPAFGTFSHQDVIDGLITYEHDGDERFLDSIQLRVSDGSATDTGTLSLQIIPVNDQPNVTASFIQLLEGESRAFTASELGVSDIDGVGDDIGLGQDSPLQVRIDTLPAHGALFYNDPINGMTPVTIGFTFDHAEIGRFSYQHDGSENFDDTFDFTVLDSNNYSNGLLDAPGFRSGVMTIGIIPVNDSPAVVVNEGLVSDGNGDRRVYEGGTRVITIDVLGSLDPDSSNEQVQYRITAAPTNGTLLLNGNPISAGTAFSQDDLFAGRVSYRHNGSETSTDQFNFRIDDGSSNVSEQTFQIGIIAVDDAPVITAPASAVINTADYHFTGTRAISIADSDAYTGDVTVTLTVSDPGGLLRVTTTTGLTSVTGNDTSNVLVLVGDVAEINAALATLHYRATDLDAAATLSINVNDGGNTGIDPSQVPFGEIIGLVDTGTNSDEQANRIVNLLVSPIDDVPVHTVPGPQTAYEDVTFVFNTAGGNAISISDVDAFGEDVQVTLSVGNGVLTLGTTTGLVFTTGDGTSDTTMTFRGTVAEVNAALEGLQYRGSSNYEGPETLVMTTNDLGNTGDGGPLSAVSNIGITVIGVNDAPTIAGPGSTMLINSATFVFNGGNTISINDSDIASGLATVTLTVNDPTGILEVTQLTGLTAISGNGTSNVLTFTGTRIDVNNALATLAYSPSDVNGAATLTVLVSDNGNTGVDPSTIGLAHTGTTSDEQATRVFNLQVSDVNDAPVNNVPGPQTFNEDTTRVFSTANGNAISISDIDAFSFDVTTTVSVTNGTLVAGGTAPQRAALTSLTGSGTNTLVLTGTVAEINAVLQGLAYSTPLHFNGTDVLTITTNDNGNTGVGGPLSDTDTVNLTITAVNDAPTITVPGNRNVNEDTALVFSTGNGNAISVADVDALEGTGLLTVTLGVTNGTLTLSGVAGLSFGTGDGTADTTMTFTGTAANINAALQGLTFNPTADYNGPAVLSISTNDNGNFGTGGALVANRSVNITVAAVADITADTVNTLEDQAVTFDVIAGTNGATADNFEGSPVITRINSTNVTLGSVVAVSNGTVTVDAVTGQLTFNPNLNYNGTTSFQYTVTSPAGVTESAQVNVIVAAVNDAPVNTVPGLQTFNEDTTRVFSTANGNAISIADVDAATGDVTTTVSVTQGVLVAGGTAPQRAALTSLTGSGTNTLVLTGTVAEINAVLQGLAYTGTLNYNGTDQLTITTNDNGNTGIGGALSDTDTVDLSITAVNDAPVNTVPGNQNGTEDTALVFSSGNGNSISVADVDALAGTGLLTVTLGVTNGTLTLSGVAGLSFATGDGTADASMTFTGTAADINIALQGLTFNPTADYNGPAVLSLSTNDNGNFGTGGALVANSSVNISVAAVADITADTVNTLEDQAVTFDVITGTNGATADNFEGSPVVTRINSTNVTLGSIVAVSNGTVTVDAVTGQLTFNPNLNYNGTTSFQYTVTSPTGVTESAQVNVVVAPVNDAPINTVPGLQTFNEDTTRVFSTANGNAISIADVDAATGDVTTTLSVANGILVVGGTGPQQAALTSIAGSGTNTLVLTGTVAEINAVLQGLAYSTPVHFNGNDQLTITTNDNGNTGVGGALADTDTVDLTITAVNDAPTHTVPGNQNVNEDNALIFSSGNGNAISVADVDALEGTGLLSVTLGVTNGTLTLSGVAGLAFATGDGTADASMTFTGTAADINAALQGLTFNPTADYNGPALLSLTTSDNGNFGTGGALVANSSVNISVAAVADITADTVNTFEDQAVTFDVIAGTNGATADNFEGSPVITMINSTPVTLGSVVAVSNGTVTVDAVTGQLTYNPSLNYNGTTNFQYTVTSPTGVTESAQVNVVVAPVNDAPVNTVPGLQTFNEDTTRVFSTANGNAISIADIDAATGDVTTTLSVTDGILVIGGTGPQQAALTSLTGSGTNTIVLTGTVAEINAVLQGLTYTGDLNFNGTDQLTITTNDNGNTGTGGALTDTDTVDLSVAAVNDAPTNTVPGNQNVDEDTALVFSTANGNTISVADIDALEGTGLLTVTLGVTNGTLTLSGVAGLAFSTGDGTTDASMTFTGTAADINVALQGLTFNPTADYNGPALLSLTTSDNGNFGTGGALVANSSVNITVAAVADITADTVSTLEDQAITFDAIAGTNGATADSFEGSPVVTMINSTPVTLGSVVSVSNGTVTVDAVTGLLTFNPSLNYNGTTSFQYTVTSPTGVTESAQVNVVVAPVNDAPVNTVPVLQTLNEDSTLIFSTANGNAISIADLDAATGDVTTTLSVADGILVIGGTGPQQAALTSITGSGTNTVVLTGTVAEINAVLQGLSYSGNLNSNGTDTLTIVTNDNGNTGAGGALTDTDTVDLSVTAINDAPTNTVPGNQSVDEDTALVFSTANGNTISVADVDALEGTGLLTVTLGVTNGTLTLSGVAGLAFATGDGTTDASMTFTGTAADINAALQGLTFIPTADYNGPALLSLSTSDNGNFGTGGALVVNSSVNITVVAVADITADVVSTPEDVAVTFDVIAGTNGATADNFEGSPVITMINSTPVTLGSVVAVANGTVTVDAVSGLLTFTPDLDYNGTTSFQYTVTSPTGITESAQVTVSVGGGNDAPVNTVPTMQNVDEDTALIFSTANGNAISINDIDASTGVMTVTLGVTNGTLSLSGVSGLTFSDGDGAGDTTMTFSGTMADINAALEGMSFNPVPDYNGAAELTITTNDNGNTGSGGDLTDSDVVGITVAPVADITNDTVATNEDFSVTFDVIAGTNGATADNFEGTPVLTAIDGVAVTTGSVIDVADGIVRVDATTGLLTFTPDEHFNGTTTFTYTVTSPTGITETATVTVNVAPQNDAPINTVPAAQNVNEDSVLTFSTANGNAITVADVDAAETTGLLTVTLGVTNGNLSLSSVAGLVFATGDGTSDTSMIFTGTAADINAALEGMTFAPVADYNGPALLTLLTSDNGNSGAGGPLTASSSVDITVAPVVDITDDNVVTDEDTVITFNVIAGTNGATTDTFEGTPVLTAINGNSFVVGTPIDLGDGFLTVDATTGILTFSPDQDFYGDVTFNYTVTSPAGVIETASVTVQVNPVNDDPFTVGTIAAQDNLDSDPVSLDVTGFFDDVDLTDVLTFSATGLPAGLSIDPDTGIISGTIDSSASVGGPYTVIVTADDGNGGTTTQTFIWSVSNPAPTAVDDQFQAGQNDGALVVGNAITNNDTDPDGDVLTALVQDDVPGDNGGLFSIDADGNVTFDPNGEFADLLGGQFRETTFSYTIVDADGATSTATVTVTVVGVNSPPVPFSNKIKVNLGSTGGKLGLTAPVDPDGDPLTITVSKLPKKGVLRFPNGKPLKVGQVLTANQLERLVFDAPAKHKGKKPVKFLYTVSDGQYVTTAKVDISIVQGTATMTCYGVSFQSKHKS